MSLISVNSGVDFAFGEVLQAADVNEIKNSAVDGRLAALFATDANQTVDLELGTIFQTTMTLSANRTVALPDDPISGSRVIIVFRHDGAFTISIMHDVTVIAVVPSPGGATQLGYAEFFFDGFTDEWRTLGMRTSVGTPTINQ